MTAVVAALVVVVSLLSILVAGLLRSHATILRRLHDLDGGADLDPGVSVRAGAPLNAAPGRSTGAPRTTRVVPRTDGTVPAPDPNVPDGRLAADIAGTDPDGDAVGVRVVEVEHDTVVVFLSSGCGSCRSFWEDLATPRLPPGTRLIVVTRGADGESPSAIRELAPPGATVIMSSQVWDDFRVPGSPFVVLVDGPSGRIVGEGTAASWGQVLELFLQAGGDQASGKASADRRREQELDRLLLSSGIAPGDPSLYGTSDTP